MDHPYHPSADACSSDEAEELPHLPSNTNCKMCAEVADRIASAQQKISGYFSDGKRRSTCVEVDCIDLGTPADFQSRSGCSTCRDISWFFKPTKGIKDDAVDGALSHLIIRLETFLYPKGWYLEITPVPECALNESRRSIYSKEARVSLSSERSSRIDIDRIQGWIANCEVKHGSTCNTPHHTELLSTTIFIDVDLNCLTSRTGPDRYIALSYVWGPSGDGQTLREHVVSYSQPGGILTCGRLPDTVRDAMHLARLFHVRYLWVDRFCIIQNDDDHKKQQIHQMSRIYECAYITVIAADGENADYGLRGIGGPSQERCRPPEIISFSSSPRFHLSVQGSELEHYFPSKWHTRGWTLQERVISRRKLIFLNGFVFWECRKETIDEESGRNIWAEHISPGDQKHPNLLHYFSLVEDYNQRELSKPADAQNAFLAILEKMTIGFPEGFHFGIPETCFDIGMLWSSSSTKPLERRPMFPSWSWLGWSGSVKLQDEFRMYAWSPTATESEEKLQIKPMTTWTKIRQDGEYIRIPNSYSYYQNLSDEKTDGKAHTHLAQGWRKYDDGLPNQFGHISCPNQRFYFPFPVVSTHSSEGYESWTNILRFSTRTCGFKLKVSDIEKSPLKAFLLDEEAEWCGSILHDQRFAGDKSTLLEISEGVARGNNQLTCEAYHGCGQSLYRPYAFYNVLQVEWKDGIAYRCGVGRVLKDAWERKKPTPVDVKLG